MERIPAFTQWLYKFKAPPFILNQAQVLAFSSQYRLNQVNLTTEVEDTISSPLLVAVRAWVDKCLAEIKGDLGLECAELKSTVEWFNQSQQGMWHQEHIHSNSFLSGILYLSPSNSCTQFRFPGLWGEQFTTLNLVAANNEKILYEQPTEVGTMVVFPSKLLHGVTPHDLPAPRYTLAFNAFPSGLLGSKSPQHYRRFMHLTINQDQLL